MRRSPRKPAPPRRAADVATSGSSDDDDDGAIDASDGDCGSDASWASQVGRATNKKQRATGAAAEQLWSASSLAEYVRTSAGRGLPYPDRPLDMPPLSPVKRERADAAAPPAHYSYGGGSRAEERCDAAWLAAALKREHAEAARATVRGAGKYQTYRLRKKTVAAQTEALCERLLAENHRLHIREKKLVYLLLLAGQRDAELARLRQERSDLQQRLAEQAERQRAVEALYATALETAAAATATAAAAPGGGRAPRRDDLPATGGFAHLAERDAGRLGTLVRAASFSSQVSDCAPTPRRASFTPDLSPTPTLVGPDLAAHSATVAAAAAAAAASAAASASALAGRSTSGSGIWARSATSAGAGAGTTVGSKRPWPLQRAGSISVAGGGGDGRPALAPLEPWSTRPPLARQQSSQGDSLAWLGAGGPPSSPPLLPPASGLGRGLSVVSSMGGDHLAAPSAYVAERAPSLPLFLSLSPTKPATAEPTASDGGPSASQPVSQPVSQPASQPVSSQATVPHPPPPAAATVAAAPGATVSPATLSRRRLFAASPPRFDAGADADGPPPTPKRRAVDTDADSADAVSSSSEASGTASDDGDNDDDLPLGCSASFLEQARAQPARVATASALPSLPQSLSLLDRIVDDSQFALLRDGLIGHLLAVSSADAAATAAAASTRRPGGKSVGSAVEADRDAPGSPLPSLADENGFALRFRQSVCSSQPSRVTDAADPLGSQRKSTSSSSCPLAPPPSLEPGASGTSLSGLLACSERLPH